MVKRRVEERDAGALVDWYDIEDRFEDLLDALIAQVHPNADRCEPIDGRGGDDGADCYVLDGGREIIYQYKYFPEGFDGKDRGRRRQIENDKPRQKLGSLNQAIKKYPDMDEWVLIAPCKPTKSGWAYIQSLRTKFPDIIITFVHRATLNGSRWVAGHPDIARAICSRDELLEKAVILNQEKAVLADGLTDFSERHRALNGVMDDVDPHWTWRFASGYPGPDTYRLVPKHPQAAEKSPVTFTLEVNDAPDGEAFRAAMTFGALDPVTIPRAAIAKFEVTGPPIVRSAHPENAELLWIELRPLVDDYTPVPLALTLYDDQGHEVGMHQGTIVRHNFGSQGTVFRHEFYDGAFAMQWSMPTSDSSAAGSVDFTFDLNPTCSLEKFRDVTDLALTLDASDSARLLTKTGQQLARVGIGERMFDDEQRFQLRVLHEVADDLVFVQREIRRQFLLPEEMTPQGRVDLRILRRLLEGSVVCMPEAQTLSVTVEPEALAQAPLRHMLSGKPGQLLAQTHPGDQPLPWVIDVLRSQGELATISLPGSLAHYFPEMAAVNGDAAREALTAGRSARLELRSPSRLRPRLYLPERIPADIPATAEPWGLTGIPEVPELRPATDEEDDAS